MDESVKVRKGVLAKIPSINAMAKEGRLHIRMYEVDSRIYITSHIDPPSIEHINILKQIKDEVEVDYIGGTKLFKSVLEDVF